MKKMLSLLGSIGMFISATSATVACFPSAVDDTKLNEYFERSLLIQKAYQKQMAEIKEDEDLFEAINKKPEELTEQEVTLLLESAKAQKLFLTYAWWVENNYLYCMEYEKVYKKDFGEGKITKEFLLQVIHGYLDSPEILTQDTIKELEELLELYE